MATKNELIENKIKEMFDGIYKIKVHTTSSGLKYHFIFFIDKSRAFNFINLYNKYGENERTVEMAPSGLYFTSIFYLDLEAFFRLYEILIDKTGD